MILQQHCSRSTMHTENSSCQTAEPLCRNTVEQAKCYKSGTATPSLPRRLAVGGETYTCKYKL